MHHNSGFWSIGCVFKSFEMVSSHNLIELVISASIYGFLKLYDIIRTLTSL